MGKFLKKAKNRLNQLVNDDKDARASFFFLKFGLSNISKSEKLTRETYGTDIVSLGRSRMKERILNKSMELIYCYGLRGFTMDDISSELGISKKTLYKYFESKNQLISENVSRIVELEKKTFLKEIEKQSDWYQKLDIMLTMYTPDDIPFKLVDELYRYFPNEKKKIEELAEFRQSLIFPLIEQGIKSGEIRADLNPAIIALVIHNIFMNPTDQNLLKTQDISVKQLLEQMKKLFFHGILETSGGRK